MLTIIIIASIVAIAGIIVHNIIDGNKLDKSAQACKAGWDAYHAREQAIVDRQTRNYQARMDEDRAARVAAEKAARIERESRCYQGTRVVNMYDMSSVSYSDYQKHINW